MQDSFNGSGSGNTIDRALLASQGDSIKNNIYVFFKYFKKFYFLFLTREQKLRRSYILYDKNCSGPKFYKTFYGCNLRMFVIS
jgi:hypothetical protein